MVLLWVTGLISELCGWRLAWQTKSLGWERRAAQSPTLPLQPASPQPTCTQRWPTCYVSQAAKNSASAAAAAKAAEIAKAKAKAAKGKDKSR